MREDWILYLLQGYIGCELGLKTNKQNRELLEKGYTVTLRQIMVDKCEKLDAIPPKLKFEWLKSADLV